jgi:exosortase A
MTDDAMHADPQMQRNIAMTRRVGIPANAIMVVFLLAWILGVYAKTTYSMVSIWERSETFAHGFVVIPIFLYLLWRDRDHLASIEPRPFPPALLGVVALGAAWLVGDRLSIIGVTQFAMIGMIPLVVWAVLGTQTLKALLFPLAFLFFAVPFGEFLEPPLMEWTADFATLSIRASGVPIFREGILLTIPSGAWSIVEACSGVRYLIASFMVGCLFAYLSYRSAIRRAAFVAASIVVPIVANWVRAYMIIMLGHVTNNRLAVGADHLIYGWVFFGVVMVLLFWIGVKWREDDLPQHATERTVVAASRPAVNRRTTWIALAFALVMTAVWPALKLQHASGRVPGNEPVLDRIADRDGWKAASEAFSSWRPDVSGATAELAQAFVKDRAPVGLFIAYFSDSSPEAKAITSTNQIVRTGKRLWAQVAVDAKATATIAGQAFNVRTTVVARGRERYAVWQWFWVDGHVTASEYIAKMYEVLAVLRGHGDPVAWVVIFTPTEGGEPQVRATLQAFTAAMYEPIDTALRNAAQER